LGSIDHNPEQHPPPQPVSNGMPSHPQKPPPQLGSFNCRRRPALIVVAQTSNVERRTSNVELRTSNFELRTSNCGGAEEEVFRCFGGLRLGVSVGRERSGGFARVSFALHGEEVTAEARRSQRGRGGRGILIVAGHLSAGLGRRPLGLPVKKSNSEEHSLLTRVSKKIRFACDLSCSPSSQNPVFQNGSGKRAGP
jgi:hypothetical protein